MMSFTPVASMEDGGVHGREETRDSVISSLVASPFPSLARRIASSELAASTLKVLTILVSTWTSCFMITIRSAGLTTLGQVTPKRINQANKSVVRNRHPAPSRIFRGGYHPCPESGWRSRMPVPHL